MANGNENKSGWIQVEGAGAIPVPDLSGAASATLQQIVQQRLQASRQSRPEFGGGLIPGATMPTPIMPQAPMKISPEGVIPQGPFASVGARKRADTQAVFSNISKIVQTAQDRQYEMKVKKLQHTFEKMSEAIRGYNEGQATGNQEMIDHNTQILNEIAMGKDSKELAKALDVNLNPMAEGKGKGKEKPNPAADAWKAAFAKDQKAYAESTAKGQTALAPQAQAIMRQMPQTLQPDPRYQQYLEGLKAGAYLKAGEQATFQKDMLEIQQRISNNKFTNETKEKIAQMFTDARDRSTMASIYRTAMTIQNAKDRMDTMERMWANRADKQYQGVHEHNQVLRDRLNASGTADDKKIVALVNGLDKMADSLKAQLETARKAHDVNKMGELSQKLESVTLMQQTINADVARRLGLNPEDFSQEQFKLDEGLMKQYELLFPDQQPPAGADAADQ